jgi:hypothetical protein
MGFDVRFKFPRVPGQPGAAHHLAIVFKHPHIIGVDLVGAIASRITWGLFGHRRGRRRRGAVGSRLAGWHRPPLCWLLARVLDEGETVAPGSVLCWLPRSSWCRHERSSGWGARVSSVHALYWRAMHRWLRCRVCWQERACPDTGRGGRNRRLRYNDTCRFACVRLRQHHLTGNFRNRFRGAPGRRPFAWSRWWVCVG